MKYLGLETFTNLSDYVEHVLQSSKIRKNGRLELDDNYLTRFARMYARKADWMIMV
jgi:hypothetical protein